MSRQSSHTHFPGHAGTHGLRPAAIERTLVGLVVVGLVGVARPEPLWVELRLKSQLVVESETPCDRSFARRGDVCPDLDVVLVKRAGGAVAANERDSARVAPPVRRLLRDQDP